AFVACRAASRQAPEKLQGHLALEFFIPRAIHHAHATFAELLFDKVVAEFLTDHVISVVPEACGVHLTLSSPVPRPKSKLADHFHSFVPSHSPGPQRDCGRVPHRPGLGERESHVVCGGCRTTNGGGFSVCLRPGRQSPRPPRRGPPQCRREASPLRRR